LLREIEEMKKRKIEIKMIPYKNKLQEALKTEKIEGEEEPELKRFIISPYVVFG
jgi:hypothetical protein